MQARGSILEKYVKRFDELIAQGEKLLDGSYEISGDITSWNVLTGQTHRGPNKQIVEWRGFVQWRTSCVALLSQVIPSSNPLRESISTFQNLKNKKSFVEWGVATLSAVRDDFDRGFMDDLLSKAESAIAVDYMAQAETPHHDARAVDQSFVAAAVLGGAVLEKALRNLSVELGNQQTSPPKTLNPLIDELRKAGLFNEAKAKQLRAWAAIRNHAAHGEFSEFNKDDVGHMLSGIRSFLTDYAS